MRWTYTFTRNLHHSSWLGKPDGQDRDTSLVALRFCLCL